MLPEGMIGAALPADYVASVDWFIVFYKDTEIMRIPVIVSPLMAPGVVQVVEMKNGQLIMHDAIYMRGFK